MNEMFVFIRTQISSTNVTDIQTQFSSSFSLIQQGIRSVRQTLEESSGTLERIIEDLDNSRWNNLVQQDRRLREEIAAIDSSYAQSKDDINASNLGLDNSLISVLDGQVCSLGFIF